MQRLSFKFLLVVLACALNVASAHAISGHTLPSDKRDELLKALRARNENGHARKLLGGTDCIQHVVSANAQPFVSVECGALLKKDEGHFCDTSEIGDFVETFTDYDAEDVDAVATVFPELCVADSLDDCCKPNGGAIAGVVIGCVAGLAAIITLFAFFCRCCCFRPKQVVVMQQQPVAAPQVVVVPAAK